MGGKYRMCDGCNAPGEKCNDCYLEPPECVECHELWEPDEIDIENEETMCPACRGVKEGDVSDTPMTDAIFKKYETGYCGISQIRLHCEDLEAKLAEAQAELKDVYKDRLFLKGDNDRLERELAEADKKIQSMQNEYIEVVHDMIAKHELQLAEAQARIKELEGALNCIAKMLNGALKGAK